MSMNRETLEKYLDSKIDSESDEKVKKFGSLLKNYIALPNSGIDDHSWLDRFGWKLRGGICCTEHIETCWLWAKDQDNKQALDEIFTKFSADAMSDKCIFSELSNESKTKISWSWCRWFGPANNCFGGSILWGDTFKSASKGTETRFFHVFRVLRPDECEVNIGPFYQPRICCKARKNNTDQRVFDDIEELGHQSDELAQYLAELALRHILYGSSTPAPPGVWISATHDLSVAMAFSGAFFSKVALISLKGIPEHFVQLLISRDHLRTILNLHRDRHSREVRSSLSMEQHGLSVHQEYEFNTLWSFVSRSQETVILDEVPKACVRYLTPKLQSTARLWPFGILDTRDLDYHGSREMDPESVIKGLGITSAEFPSAEYINPENIERIESLQGPNHGLLKIKFKSPQNSDSSEHFILKRAKPNVEEGKLISAAEMRVQLHTIWVANAIWRLFRNDDDNKLHELHQCCLVEYESSFSDFFGLGPDQKELIWNGSFILFRDVMPALIDAHQEARDVVCCCLLGIPWSTYNNYKRSRNIREQHLALLDHALGGPAVERCDRKEFHHPEHVFDYLETFLKNGGDALSPESLKQALITLSDVHPKILSLASILDRDLTMERKDRESNRNGGLSFQQCLDRRITNLKSYCSFLRDSGRNLSDTTPRADSEYRQPTADNLKEFLENPWNRNRIALLYSEPCLHEDDQPVGLRSIFTEELRSQMSDAADFPISDENIEVKVGTIESFEQAANDHEVVVLNTRVEINESYLKFYLETEADPKTDPSKGAVPVTINSVDCAEDDDTSFIECLCRWRPSIKILILASQSQEDAGAKISIPQSTLTFLVVLIQGPEFALKEFIIKFYRELSLLKSTNAVQQIFNSCTLVLGNVLSRCLLIAPKGGSETMRTPCVFEAALGDKQKSSVQRSIVPSMHIKFNKLIRALVDVTVKSTPCEANYRGRKCMVHEQLKETIGIHASSMQIEALGFKFDLFELDLVNVHGPPGCEKEYLLIELARYLVHRPWLSFVMRKESRAARPSRNEENLSTTDEGGCRRWSTEGHPSSQSSGHCSVPGLNCDGFVDLVVFTFQEHYNEHDAIHEIEANIDVTRSSNCWIVVDATMLSLHEENFGRVFNEKSLFLGFLAENKIDMFVFSHARVSRLPLPPSNENCQVVGTGVSWSCDVLQMCISARIKHEGCGKHLSRDLVAPSLKAAVDLLSADLSGEQAPAGLLDIALPLSLLPTSDLEMIPSRVTKSSSNSERRDQCWWISTLFNSLDPNALQQLMYLSAFPDGILFADLLETSAKGETHPSCDNEAWCDHCCKASILVALIEVNQHARQLSMTALEERVSEIFDVVTKAFVRTRQDSAKTLQSLEHKGLLVASCNSNHETKRELKYSVPFHVRKFCEMQAKKLEEKFPLFKKVTMQRRLDVIKRFDGLMKQCSAVSGNESCEQLSFFKRNLPLWRWSLDFLTECLGTETLDMTASVQNFLLASRLLWTVRRDLWNIYDSNKDHWPRVYVRKWCNVLRAAAGRIISKSSPSDAESPEQQQVRLGASQCIYVEASSFFTVSASCDMDIGSIDSLCMEGVAIISEVESLDSILCKSDLLVLWGRVLGIKNGPYHNLEDSNRFLNEAIELLKAQRLCPGESDSEVKKSLSIALYASAQTYLFGESGGGSSTGRYQKALDLMIEDFKLFPDSKFPDHKTHALGLGLLKFASSTANTDALRTVCGEFTMLKLLNTTQDTSPKEIVLHIAQHFLFEAITARFKLLRGNHFESLSNLCKSLRTYFEVNRRLASLQPTLSIDLGALEQGFREQVDRVLVHLRRVDDRDRPAAVVLVSDWASCCALFEEGNKVPNTVGLPALKLESLLRCDDSMLRFLAELIKTWFCLRGTSPREALLMYCPIANCILNLPEKLLEQRDVAIELNRHCLNVLKKLGSFFLPGQTNAHYSFDIREEAVKILHKILGLRQERPYPYIYQPERYLTLLFYVRDRIPEADQEKIMQNLFRIANLRQGKSSSFFSAIWCAIQAKWQDLEAVTNRINNDFQVFKDSDYFLVNAESHLMEPVDNFSKVHWPFQSPNEFPPHPLLTDWEWMKSCVKACPELVQHIGESLNSTKVEITKVLKFDKNSRDWMKLKAENPERLIHMLKLLADDFERKVHFGLIKSNKLVSSTFHCNLSRAIIEHYSSKTSQIIDFASAIVSAGRSVYCEPLACHARSYDLIRSYLCQEAEPSPGFSEIFSLNDSDHLKFMVSMLLAGCRGLEMSPAIRIHPGTPFHFSRRSQELFALNATLALQAIVRDGEKSKTSERCSSTGGNDAAPTIERQSSGSEVAQTRERPSKLHKHFGDMLVQFSTIWMLAAFTSMDPQSTNALQVA